ncbi:MAG: hypothetical protein JWO38_3602 [Gemmataceae bacterium]|nr:hypothetical protein [Gemmataceae bacterium]
MTTQLRRLSLLLAAAAIAFLIRPGAADEKAPLKAPPPAGKAEIPDLLARRVTLGKFEGKFGDILKLLREKCDLPLAVDPTLKTGDEPIEDQPVKIPALTNVRAETVLRLACDQVEVAFLTEPEYIWITNWAAALYEAGVLKQPDSAVSGDEPILPLKEMQKARPLTQRALVTAAFKGKPLAEIIDAIAELTGANVVLAPQVAEKTKQSLTVRFANTPVEAAVRTLCEMTDLGVIEEANVLLVTTKERADARAKVDDEKRKARQSAGAVGFGGAGGLGGAVGGLAAPADVAGELAKLKEQNEQLKRQLDEIQKLLKK